MSDARICHSCRACLVIASAIRSSLPPETRSARFCSEGARKLRECRFTNPLGVAKQGFQVWIQEDALRVELIPQPPEVLPPGVSCGQLGSRHRVQLTPMRSPFVPLEDFFDSSEILFVRHAAIHVNRDIAGVPARGRAQPDVIRMNKSALDRKMYLKPVSFDAMAYLAHRIREMLGRQVVFHFLEPHQTRRRV